MRFTEVATPAGGESLAVGRDGLVSWTESHAKAWVGLLETYKSLIRELDAELEAEHGLTMSALEALTRLRGAEGQGLRLSALATMSGLSLSRISRITDSLEARGLVERRTVESDRRAVEAHLTEAGLELARRAQATHVASVQRLFFEQLSDREVALLAEVFSRFAPVPAVRETEQARSQALAGPLVNGHYQPVDGVSQRTAVLAPVGTPAGSRLDSKQEDIDGFQPSAR